MTDVDIGQDSVEILTVDDVPDNIKLLRDILNKRGYKVRPALNGPDAIEAAINNKPDLILLDIKMPGMDGFEVCKRLQESDQTKDIPIIFVTASVDSAGLVRGFQLGAVDYLTKPVNEDEVLARVNTHLELSHMRKNLQEMVELRTRDLQKSRLMYKEAEKIAHLGHWELNHETSAITWSDEVYRIFRVNMTKQKPSYDLFINRIHPDDRERVNRAFTESIESRLPYETVHRLLMDDGEIRHVRERGLTEYSEDGSPTRSVGTVYDISKEVEVEQELEKKALEAKEALLGLVSAVARTVMVKDPYTAKHQRRATEIAVAIAEKLEIDPFRVEGLRLGASIHDIGQLGISPEMLLKPAKLTGAEFDEVKTHSLGGLEILEGINFPWPIIEMVSQHHERLDGSGYPNGLKGDEICLEARILAVADVFEAMTSDRPHRKSLGIDRAMQELSTGRSNCFDPEVVDALLELLDEDKGRFNG